MFVPTTHFQASPYRVLLKYMLFGFVASAAFRLMIALLINFGLVEPLSEIDLMPIQTWGYWALVYLVLVGPLFEELIWRLPLTYSPRNLALSMSLGAFYVFNNLPYFEVLDTWILAAPCLMLYAVLLWWLQKEEASKQQVKAFWEKHSNLIFYLSTITFGLVHLTNYEALTQRQLLLTPLLVAPQIVMGYYLAKIRLSHGLLWSVQLHILNNVCAALVILMQKGAPH